MNYDWPVYGSDKAFWPASVEPHQTHNNRVSVSPLSGDVQTGSVPGSYWGWTFNFSEQFWDERARLWAFLSRLEGQKNRARIFDPHQPRPAGSISLAGVTAAAAAQFATSIALRNCGAGKTLLPGDWFNVGGQQLVQTVVGGTADGSGNLTVEFRQQLRAAVAVGAAITLDQPRALYILTTPDIGTAYGPGYRAPAFSITFREVFA
jgi:hypothetical protein